MFGCRLLSAFHDDLEPENVDFSLATPTNWTKHINTLLLSFWNSWTNEYLTGLREFHKGHNHIPRKQISV